MTLKTGLATALVAAVVAAIVSAGTLGILWHYLTNNPEIVAEMRAELNRRQQEEQSAQLQKQLQKPIADNADALFRSHKAPFVGNSNGDVTVVEFFDYNCSYCRRAVPDVAKLLENDSKVKVVFKQLPIFGDDSGDAAKGALAAAKQGKYFDMHQKLFSDPGRANKDKVLRIAKVIGLNLSQLEKDMESEDVQAALDEAQGLAQKLGIRGTPFYLIGDRFIGGAPQDLYDQLVKKVSEVREQR